MERWDMLNQFHMYFKLNFGFINAPREPLRIHNHQRAAH